MAELHYADLIVIIVYFALCMGVGLWSSCTENTGSVKGYFLAGRNMIWLPVGASIFATNFGSHFFVGMAGSAAAGGLAVVIYEWHAVFILMLLGWVFVPVYVSSGAYTMPQYLKKRFGGRRLRIYLSVLAIFLLIIQKISASMYAGAIFIQQSLGWNMYVSIVSVTLITAVYTIIGGLSAVIWTDTLQTVIMMIGSIYLTLAAFVKVGGMEALFEKYMHAAPNVTTCGNVTMGFPREDSLHIFRDPTTGDIPWPGAIFGLTPMAILAWCTDQVMVQRVLAAKTHSHAKGGVIFAAWLKITPFFLVILPGMIGRVLFPEIITGEITRLTWEITQLTRVTMNTAMAAIHMNIKTTLGADLNRLQPDKVTYGIRYAIKMTAKEYSTNKDEIGCVDPDICMKVCENPNGCSNIVYPKLVVEILPSGVRGLMLACMLSALMSTLTSVFNSSSSMFTLDLWAKWRRKASERELMIVGRVFIVVLVVISILWVPILMANQGAQLWNYLQAVQAYLAPPWVVIFILGLFWKRTTEKGAFWGLMAGLAVGGTRLIIDLSYPKPACGEEETRPSILYKVHFLHFAIILTGIVFAVCIVVSLLTEPRDEVKLRRVTWMTRRSEPREESDDEDNFKREDSEAIEAEEEIKEAAVTVKQKVYNILCCYSSFKEKPKSKEWEEEQAEIYRGVNEKPWVRRFLDFNALLVMGWTAFLISLFA